MGDTTDLKNAIKRQNFNEDAPPRKKERLSLSTQDFPNRFKSEERVKALNDFLILINGAAKTKSILNYLKQGGTCIEILQVMDENNSVSSVTVFEIINEILLQINANFPQFKFLAQTTGQHLLSNYITFINKMLGLSSTTRERVVVLKLLTSIATVSTLLAKDVLLHVNFNPTNLELLSKAKHEVRNVFIHFTMALLVDGHFASLSMILEKKKLIPSVIIGLKSDPVDTVILVLTVMKDNILENPSVSKTMKMKIFNTQTVKAIVNLYNWKGPDSANEKNAVVDELKKSQVNEAVHSFLLVLCTSHKYGIIFKNHALGLDKLQNGLVNTILQSLENPWSHSYAAELVIKICRACPDLVKFVWTMLKPELEPRWTTKWLNAVRFAGELSEALEPKCTESYLNGINVYQVVQIVSSLVAPSGILKIVIPRKRASEKPAIRYHTLRLLVSMLKSTENYLNKLKEWPHLNGEILRKSLADHIRRNFLSVKFVLDDWNQADGDSSVAEYLATAFDYLEKCQVLAPDLLNEIDSVIDVEEFLNKVGENVDKVEDFQIRIVKLFVDLVPALFRPKTDLFKLAVKLSLELYFNDKDLTALHVMHDMLKCSGVFDGFFTEIDIWIDGVINLKSYSDEIGDFLCKIIYTVDDGAACYNTKLFEFKNGNFSPLLLVLENHVDEIANSKSLKQYFNFVIVGLAHLQVDLTVYLTVISKLNFIPSSLLNYIENWKMLKPEVLHKCKGNVLDHMKIFSNEFIESKLEIFDLDLYPNFQLNLLQAAVFYLTNLIQGEMLKGNQVNNFKILFKQLLTKNLFEDTRYIRAILAHSAILQGFNIFDSNSTLTQLVLELVRDLKDYAIEEFLTDYRRKTVSSLLKVFTKPHKYTKFSIAPEILETLKMQYEECCTIIEKFITGKENRSFHSIICYCLNRMAELAKNNYDLQPLNGNVVKELSVILSILIKERASNVHNFSSALLNYLQTFPHDIENVETELVDNLLTMEEYQKENILLSLFLLDRRIEFMASFEKNFNEISSKRSFLLSLLSVVMKHSNDESLRKIFEETKSHIIKALQKPHKAGQHFQNNYESVGILIDKFMDSNEFGSNIQKFDVTELFHIYLLKIIYSKSEKKPKNVENMIMTFVHLLTNLFKQKSASKPVQNFEAICQIFFEFLTEIKTVNLEPPILLSTETFKLFCKLSLKYGIEGDKVLLKILSELVEMCIGEEDGQLILEMFLSHSQFLDVILGESDKSELLHLWLVLCTKWPKLMEKNHIPLLLSSYKATRSQSDRTVLELLKLYELKQEQTSFNDFKPFLWGPAAVSHYSVRSTVQKTLWRQPKMSDILNNLHEPTVLETISHPQSPDSYDLDYFLPLFSHLLAPENPVGVYTFIRSGALALTISGFMGDKSQRLATFYVLSRFYFHLDAQNSGKDHLLWLRFIEVICKGVSVLEDFEVNNFVGVFLARTAMILTRPSDVMYVPLTQYLSAKDVLDFSTIPELYTFLHSSHVDSDNHRQFILEVIRDGLRSDRDFTVLSKSMGLKLISEMCSNTFCDVSKKILILDILQTCCRIPLGFKVLCGNTAFLTYISSLFTASLQKKDRDSGVLLKLLDVLKEIVRVDDNSHRNFIVYLHLITVCENDEYFEFVEEHKGLDIFYEILSIIVKRYSHFFTREHLNLLLKKSKDQYCNYLSKYKCRYVKESDICGDESVSCLRLLFHNKLIRES